jgi:hypothetical protein
MKIALVRLVSSAAIAFLLLLLWRLGFAAVASVTFAAIGFAVGLEIIFLFH